MVPQHLLVIDDQPALLHFLCRSLQQHWPSCVVDAASSAKQAHALVADNYYDAIVTDYHLEDGTGLQVASAAQKRMPVPVILMTASAQRCIQPSGLSSEAVTFQLLRKPFDLHQLFAALESETRVDNGSSVYD